MSFDGQTGEKVCKGEVMIHLDVLSLIYCTSLVALVSTPRKEFMSKKET